MEVIMKFLVKVKVDAGKLAEFGRALASNELDRSAVRGDTHCLREDPAVGYSVWETADRADFEARFAPWRRFYAEAEARELISPAESFAALSRKG
jgi:hypothetical protein